MGFCGKGLIKLYHHLATIFLELVWCWKCYGQVVNFSFLNRFSKHSHFFITLWKMTVEILWETGEICWLPVFFPFPSIHSTFFREQSIHLSHFNLHFACLQYRAFENTGKTRNCSWWAISPFPKVFSTCLENFMPFHQFKIFPLHTVSVWNSLKFVDWGRDETIV